MMTFVERPISASLLAIAAVIFLGPVMMAGYRRLRRASATAA
jgi:hypothetical protein